MRIGIGLGLGAGGSPQWSPLRESSVNHWYYAGSNVTLATTKASVWGDRDTPAKDISQGTDAQRPTYASTGGPFGDSPHLLFDGNVNTRLVAAAAADWAFLHNASDKFLAVSYVATGGSYQNIIDTCDWTSTNVGIALVHRGGSQLINLVIANGTGAQALSVESAAGSATDSAAHVVLFTMTAAGVYVVYVDSVSVLSGTWANTPSAAAPTYAMTVGGRASATSFDLFGKVGEIVTGTGVPDAALRAKITNYMNFTAR